MIVPEDVSLQSTSISKISDSESLAVIEKNHILKILEKTDWNLSEAARILGIHRNTLRLKIKEFDLKEPEKKKA